MTEGKDNEEFDQITPYEGKNLDALIRGLARWDRALEDNPDRKRVLQASHIAVDSDIPRYFISPSSMAGGVGLRYYGREDTVHPKERAAATALASELGRWMMYDLSSYGKNGKGTPLILFPSIAVSLGRSFEYFIANARNSFQKADGILQNIRALLSEMGQQTKQDILLDLVREFASAYCGDNEEGSPIPLFELERIESIFNEELLTHVTRYRFPEVGDPPFLPELDEGDIAAFRDDWAKQFDKQLCLYPNGSLNKSAMRKAGVAGRQLDDKNWPRLADDADMMAWLDILNSGIWLLDDKSTVLPCTLITGSGRIRRAARQYHFSHLVFEPIDFLPHLFFDESRDLTEDTRRNLYSFRDRLRSVLFAVWQAWDDDSSQEKRELNSFQAWRDFLAENDQGYNSDAYAFVRNKLGTPQTVEYLEAIDRDWQDFTSTFAVADKRFRDELVGLLNSSALYGTDSLSDALGKLMERASGALDESFEYSNIILAREIVDTARNVPPIRLEVMESQWSGVIREIVRSRRREQSLSRETLVELRAENPSLFDLVSGLTQCALNQWSLASAANFRIDNLLLTSQSFETDTERLFCAAVVKRVTATDNNDLAQAKQLIYRCRANSKGNPFYRLEAEDISIGVAGLWFAEISGNSGNSEPSRSNRRKYFVHAHSLLRQLMSSPPSSSEFIFQYVVQQLAVNCIQLALLDRYVPLLPNKDRPTLQIIPRPLNFQTLVDEKLNIQSLSNDFQKQCLDLTDNKPPSGFKPVVSNFVRATWGVCSAEFSKAKPSELDMARAHLERMCRQPPAVTKIDPVRYPFYLRIVERCPRIH